MIENKVTYIGIGTIEISFGEASRHIMEVSDENGHYDARKLKENYLPMLDKFVEEHLVDGQSPRDFVNGWLGYLYLNAISVEGSDLSRNETEFESVQRRLKDKFGLQLGDKSELILLQQELGRDIRSYNLPIAAKK